MWSIELVKSEYINGGIFRNIFVFDLYNKEAIKLFKRFIFNPRNTLTKYPVQGLYISRLS